MKNIIIILFFFIWSDLFSQTIYPIEFENYSAKWCVISGKVIDTVTIFYGRKPIAYDGNIFLVSDIWGSYYNGYQVDKISSDTGEKLWSTSFKTTANDRERIKNYYINSDNEFELLTMKEYDNDYFIWQKASFMKRTFNIEKGNELSNLFIDYSIIPMLLNWGSTRNAVNLFRNNHILAKGNNYQYVDMFTNGKSYFHTTGFNDDEDIIKDTMFKVEFLGHEKKISSQVVGNKICYLWDAVKNDFVSTHRMYFKRLDEHLNFDIELDLTKKMDQADGYRLSFANDSVFIVNAFHGFPFNGRIDYKDYSIYLFDMNGNVLDKIYIEKSDDVERFKPGVATILNSDNKLLVVSTYRDLNGIGHLDFLRSSLSNDSTVVLKTLKMVNNDFVDVDLVLQMPDGDILVGFGHYIFVKNTEDNSKSYNTHRAEWQLFDVEDFGILSSYDQIQPDFFKINIYPNPSKGKFRIDCNHQVTFQSVLVYNHLGKLIQTFPYKKNMNLGHLPNGVYELVFLDESLRNIGSKRIIISK